MIGKPFEDGGIQDMIMFEPETIVTGGRTQLGAVVTVTVIVLENELQLYEFLDLILKTYVAPVVTPLNRQFWFKMLSAIVTNTPIDQS